MCVTTDVICKMNAEWWQLVVLQRPFWTCKFYSVGGNRNVVDAASWGAAGFGWKDRCSDVCLVAEGCGKDVAGVELFYIVNAWRNSCCA